MLDRLLADPIQLTVDGEILRFCSLADFEFCLAGYTCIASRKIIKMSKLGLGELKKEARAIKEAEKRLVTMLHESMGDADRINEGFRGMNPQIFTHDNRWRAIIRALSKDDSDKLNPLRRVALEKYVQYLASRREIIKYMYLEKNKTAKDNINSKGDADRKAPKGYLTPENSAHKTTVKNNGEIAMERMLKGENVTITLADDEQLDIYISRHKCKIIGGEPNKFIDENGRCYKLITGKNTIGRSVNNTIIMNPWLRDVSRTHIIVELDADNTMYITDLSSRGTYIPESYMHSMSFL